MFKRLSDAQLKARVAKVENYIKETGCYNAEAFKKTKVTPAMYYQAKQKLKGKTEPKMKVHKVDVPNTLSRKIEVGMEGDMVVLRMSKEAASQVFSKLF